ncbi:acetoacetate--CoA ligase [Paraburkholderia sp. DHOC27]|uniref:acetoacetate--CoA ligase n=1 Tax=Paraburkholderia sp. DHOC27 TaxID=2303330 RepID=UPI000E3D6A79|nr:acetoacetate--CoA ligase [Paraburkholderia sp. DHOC27]RFU48278.1 acetoacetate--CoA ligase [Paraburkholderia sp. DHOC27]
MSTNDSLAGNQASRAAHVPQIRLYQDWLKRSRGLAFDSYDALWRWSVTDLDAFWASIWEYGGMQSPTPYNEVLAEERMPGARWFSGAQVNYAQQVLRHGEAAHAAGMPAIVSEDEQGRVRELSWRELKRQAAALALTLREQGVQRGDRVVAYLPNVPETVVAFLACSSIGAVWSVCAPDMGLQAVSDRFRQIEPRVLIAVDGVHYAGRPLDRSQVVASLRDALPTVQTLIVLETPNASSRVADALSFAAVTARDDAATAGFVPEWLPFDHPLWVVYSSGTTGLPKPIVQGHGGVLVTALSVILHTDYGASYSSNNWGERFHWYTSTGWIMWNVQLTGLLVGATICLYDGCPSGSKERPDWGVLWRFAARHHVTVFGAGAAFHGNCMKAGLSLAECGDLSRVRAIGTTGSPLPEDVQRWGSAQFAALGNPDIWWLNISGGTDLSGNFLTGNRELPQVPGRMQCRQLGAAVEAWNEAGQAVLEEVGELVCTRPIPAMPLYFWGDAGNARYLSSYFDVYPGVWRHGDWLKIDADGACTIYGRSDATINRAGLRMGTSEIYAAVEALPEVLDSMVIDLEFLGRESFLALFVVLRDGIALDAALEARLTAAIKTSLSPRFVPDQILQAPEIPRTLSGKKQEVPIKKLFLGHVLEKVVNREAMANPQCLDWYVRQAAAHAAQRGG